jgi:hypothetical protein
MEGHMEPLTIRNILDQVLRGQIRIPAFQRDFVWEPDRVAHLMDSIYKRYPFGSLLFWRTREQLRIERDLGPFLLPDPKEDYPVDYVLDGQQRITSIFGVFQTELSMSNPKNWRDIYFDLQADQSAQDTQFLALPSNQVDPNRHFPLNTLFNTAAYRKAVNAFDESAAERIDKVYEVFKEASIPVQISHTEDRATVAIIFERINRQGIELDTLQLLSAWTWSEEFQLQEQFEELADQLAPFGFKAVGGDTNLLLRCCSAVLSHDASPEALMRLNGSRVRADFDHVINGVKYAVDYLRNNFKVENLSNLPFSTLLVPLSVFFSVSGNREASCNDEQRKQINRWFWRASFSKRYSSGVLRSLKTDIEEMLNLKNGRTSHLGNFDVSIGPDFFLENTFGMNSVNTKTFILVLAQKNPLSFISGGPVDLATTLKQSNRTEFHHLMPKAFIQHTNQTEYNDSALANFCFLSRFDNRVIGGRSPSSYRAVFAKNIDEILERAICPHSLFSDQFKDFMDDRAQMLVTEAKKLCQT